MAHWAGATVITTVSSKEKAQLAGRAGAHHVVNYRDTDAADRIRAVAPAGGRHCRRGGGRRQRRVGRIGAQAGRHDRHLRQRRGVPFAPDVRTNMGLNTRYQFVLLYTVGWDRIANAATDVNQAIDDGAFQVGDQTGLPLHRFDLDDTAAAHDAVESATVGKVLISVSH